MSKSKSEKKVVVTSQKASPTESRLKSNAPASASSASKENLIFSNANFLWMGIGFILVLGGILLMTGGDMPDPNTWDENIIYSTRRTVLAPIVIVAGLVVEVYAIFKK